MKNILFLFLLILQTTFSQEKVTDTCNLQIDNNNWRKSFERTISKEEKLNLIKEKIASDSKYSEYRPRVILKDTPTLNASVVDELGNICGVKIIFSLVYNDIRYINLDLNKHPEYLKIVNNLGQNNINEILCFFDEKAMSLYGIYGQSGVIYIKTDNKELIKLIKKIKRQNK
jgi:hypothetical protein